jgi:hypothetical protein
MRVPDGKVEFVVSWLAESPAQGANEIEWRKHGKRE